MYLLKRYELKNSVILSNTTKNWVKSWIYLVIHMGISYKEMT